jgi:hypothetical protein
VRALLAGTGINSPGNRQGPCGKARIRAGGFAASMRLGQQPMAALVTSGDEA